MKIETRNVVLPDNRNLSYAEYGDPMGQPLFYFHGLPGSRLEASIANEFARNTKVRIIALDRPGMGDSTFVPNRNILDFSEDVAQVADTLDIPEFSVLGVSGGSPYALGCAVKIPERVSAVGIVSGMVPLNNETYSEFKGFFRFIFDLARYEKLFQGFLKTTNLPFSSSLYIKTLSLADLQSMSIPGRREFMRENANEAAKKGFQGRARETYLLTQPWGFDLKDIQQTVNIWHGDCDETIPIGLVDYFKREIPQTQSFTFQGEGHYAIFNHIPEIISALK